LGTLGPMGHNGSARAGCPMNGRSRRGSSSVEGRSRMGGSQAKGESAGPVGEGTAAKQVGRRARSRSAGRTPAADPDRRARRPAGDRGGGERPPGLSEERILAWAEAHQARTENWPTVVSGAIDEAPGETWREVDRAMRFGLRGLPGYSSLARLVARAREADE